MCDFQFFFFVKERNSLYKRTSTISWLKQCFKPIWRSGGTSTIYFLFKFSLFCRCFLFLEFYLTICLRLQKINQKNTWELNLIDHLCDIIKVEEENDSETNFQKVYYVHLLYFFPGGVNKCAFFIFLVHISRVVLNINIQE